MSWTRNLTPLRKRSRLTIISGSVSFPLIRDIIRDRVGLSTTSTMASYCSFEN